MLIIDADLQDPPELLGELCQSMDEGFDVVYARRRSRRRESRFKSHTADSLTACWAASSDLAHPRDVGDFR